jgi:hypothetical protein
MPVPESPYDESKHSRVGYWDLKVGVDTMKWQLDIDSFLKDIRNRMWQVEEKITRKLIVEKLRELGYTVIEPEEES